MANSLREKVVDQVKSLPEAQLRIAFNFLKDLPGALPPGTPEDDVFRFAGIWNDEDGAEIAAIIERDCERVPEE